MLIYLHFLCIFKLLAAVAATLRYAPISPNLPLYDDSLHTQRTRKMASITKLPPGAYRVQIRRKGRYASKTFLPRDDAHRWARRAEDQVDRGLAPNKSSVSRLQTFGDLIDLHITDMCEVGKPPRRSKAATLTTLKRDLGKEKIGHLDRQKLIDYGKMRAEQGAGPVTLGIDIGVIKMIITHAAAVHGLDISPEPVDLARVALKRLGLIGKGTERDRRSSTDELNRLFRRFDDNERLTLPMTRIVKFAVATAMRLDEICRVEWTDLDVDRRMLLIRDRKDPRNKTGNDQRIPLFAATGFDAWALVTEQAKELGHAKGRIFPYNSRSVGTRAALKTMTIKADRKDARGIAHLMRMGWFRPVHCKSTSAQEVRALLTARKMLQGKRHDIEMSLRGVLRGFGLKVGPTTPKTFEERIRDLIEANDTLTQIAEALLSARATLMRGFKGSLESRLLAQARRDARTRLLMTTPGVGALTALTFTAAIDDPARFRSSRMVGAHFGLTPTKYQSGETDVTGRISKVGVHGVRVALYEAANVILTRPVKGSALKSWALAVARRAGMKKAKVALARKLAVVLHRMLRTGQGFALDGRPVGAGGMICHDHGGKHHRGWRLRIQDVA